MINSLQIIRAGVILSFVLPLLSLTAFCTMPFCPSPADADCVITTASVNSTGMFSEHIDVAFIVSSSYNTFPASGKSANYPQSWKIVYTSPSVGLILDTVSWKDIIITEIFPDPTPVVGLPEFEYVEIFNRTDHDIHLKDWQLTDESSILILPDTTLHTAEYMILTSTPALFEAIGLAWGSSDFPSLNNTEDLLILYNSAGNIVDSVHYNDEWYRDNERNDGGWALELIDPENLCSESENWIVSDESTGGTPGRQNNMLAEKPDILGPKLLSAIPMTDQRLQLLFNERLSAQVPQFNSFSIEPPLLIDSIFFKDNSFTTLIMTLTSTIQTGVTYSIALEEVYDCTGNAAREDVGKTIFGKPELAITGDIIINEILFNPKPGGVDFVEFVNPSGKFIDISKWSVGNLEQGIIKNAEPLMRTNKIISPGAYLVLTEHKDALLSDYPLSRGEAIFEVDRLPPLNDDDGDVIILDENDSIIDHFKYSASMHSIFIRDPEGVSLERISYQAPSNNHENWKSASSDSGFATPGFVNSNASLAQPLVAGSVTVEPQAFIPITGQPDFTQIYYRFEQGGYVANIRIYDDRGRMIKEIANNEILGTEGSLRWDGDKADGNRARTGYYMIWFEIFDASGRVRTFKEGVAVAARF